MSDSHRQLEVRHGIGSAQHWRECTRSFSICLLAHSTTGVTQLRSITSPTHIAHSLTEDPRGGVAMLVDTSLSTIVQQGLRRVALQRDASTRLRWHAERVRREHAALFRRPLPHQPIPSAANTIMSVCTGDERRLRATWRADVWMDSGLLSRWYGRRRYNIPHYAPSTTVGLLCALCGRTRSVTRMESVGTRPSVCPGHIHIYAMPRSQVRLLCLLLSILLMVLYVRDRDGLRVYCMCRWMSRTGWVRARPSVPRARVRAVARTSAARPPPVERLFRGI
ncbi:hypothetical protein B0H13DRAFT_2663649 [Mycena leptocephala]|nr:hypothetical protein B0H13DRAFT_2663649 [Mycena leptocephala]